MADMKTRRKISSWPNYWRSNILVYCVDHVYLMLHSETSQGFINRNKRVLLFMNVGVQWGNGPKKYQSWPEYKYNYFYKPTFLGSGLELDLFFTVGFCWDLIYFWRFQYLRSHLKFLYGTKGFFLFFCLGFCWETEGLTTLSISIPGIGSQFWCNPNQSINRRCLGRFGRHIKLSIVNVYR